VGGWFFVVVVRVCFEVAHTHCCCVLSLLTNHQPLIRHQQHLRTIVQKMASSILEPNTLQASLHMPPLAVKWMETASLRVTHVATTLDGQPGTRWTLQRQTQSEENNTTLTVAQVLARRVNTRSGTMQSAGNASSASTVIARPVWKFRLERCRSANKPLVTVGTSSDLLINLTEVDVIQTHGDGIELDANGNKPQDSATSEAFNRDRADGHWRPAFQSYNDNNFDMTDAIWIALLLEGYLPEFLLVWCLVARIEHTESIPAALIA